MADPVGWDRGTAEREAKAMFGNQALHRAAAAMAGCHPRALDYIRQAPVIVLSATAGRTGTAGALAAIKFAGPPMRMLCERNAKLRDVMSFYGCGYQLRALAPSVLHPTRWPVVYHLGRLPPSTLAQIIPSTRKDQDVWLRSLTYWAEHCDRRCRNRWLRFDWAATALRTVRRGEEGAVSTVADLVIAAGQREPSAGASFEARWTFDQAKAAAERWHAALGRERAEQAAAQGLGIGFAVPVDYAPYPNDAVAVDGFEFIPLRTCEALYLEGAAMHHCVASYSRAMVGGRARIFSVRRDGRRVATLEMGSPTGSNSDHRTHRIVQLKGACNARPAAAVTAAAKGFERAMLDAFRDADDAKSRQPRNLRAAFPGVSAMFSAERGAA